jgi:hypothetical protein
MKFRSGRIFVVSCGVWFVGLHSVEGLFGRPIGWWLFDTCFSSTPVAASKGIVHLPSH